MSLDKPKFQLSNWEIVSVNPVDKTWTWKDYFCLWANMTQSLIAFSLIASLYLLYDLNILIVFVGSLIAGLLVYLFSNLIGKPSTKHGIPFVVFLRTSLGINGARYFGMIRGLVGIFFFGVQTFFISKSLGYLIRISLFSIDANLLQSDYFLLFFMGLNLIDWISLLFTLLFQFFLFSKGHKFIKIFINFSGFFVYFGILFFLIILFSEFNQQIVQRMYEVISLENIFIKNNIVPLITITGTIFAYYSIVILNFGDFSRYAKNDKELNIGNLSLLLNLIIFSILAILISLGADILINKDLIEAERFLTNPTDIIGKINNTYLTVTCLIFIFIASLSSNLIANYIPSQNALINFFPKQLSLKSSGVVMMIFGVIIGSLWLSLISQLGILSFVDTFGSFFGPIFGLMICDYYVIKSKKIINKDLFSSNEESSYFYSNGWHIKAMYAVLIGFIFSAGTIWNSNLNFLQSFSWILGAIATYITYYLLVPKKL